MTTMKVPFFQYRNILVLDFKYLKPNSIMDLFKVFYQANPACLSLFSAWSNLSTL